MAARKFGQVGLRSDPVPPPACRLGFERDTLVSGNLIRGSLAEGSTLIAGGGERMEIGKPLRTVTVEPVEDPVPRQQPAKPPPRKQPAKPPPRKQPAKPPPRKQPAPAPGKPLKLPA